MKRWLVTGAGGFVGRHFVAQLDGEVIGIGRRKGPALSDTAGLRRLITEFAPDCVVHLAAATHAASAEDLQNTNVAGTLSLLEALPAKARFVFASSASVYGEPRRLPIDEDHPCEPVNPYGASKLAAEKLVRALRPDAIVARIFNVFGPGQPADHVCGRLIAQLSSGAAQLQAGPLWPTRDFIDVRDVVRALHRLALDASPGSIVNVASGRETSVREILETLLRVARRRVEIVEAKVPPGVARIVADVSRLRALGFESKHGLEETLSAAYSEMRSSPAARIPA